MKRKLLLFLQRNWPIIFLTGLLWAIFITNFTPSTWLVGWDNLMPELNITVNIKRSIMATWQEYQGLGLVGGMGHAADLMRQLILWPFVLLLPTNLIRYLWHFGMLALGTWGIYWGLGQFKKELNEKTRVLAALFYLLNFGTIQYFWPPFEAFSTFWGFFPWLIFLFWRNLQKPTKKSWLAFGLANLLATPAFYNPTLFVVYLVCLASLSTVAFLEKPKSKIDLLKKEKLPKKIKKTALIIFLINLFWLLPFTYFFVTNRHHPKLAIINQMSSEETSLRNQKRGNLKDFLLLRGYYYDFPDGEEPLMKPWQEHFSQPWVTMIGLLLGGVSVLGCLSVVVDFFQSRHRLTAEKNRHFKLGILLIWLIGAVGMLSTTPPFSWLNLIFRSSPFLDQVFRAPFTKFIVPSAFSFSILFAFGTKTLTGWFRKVNQKLALFFYLLLFVFFGVFSSPVFRGNFFYHRMRVKIPNEYFQLFDFFKNQAKTARIANLPQGNFWGWTFYRWDLRGSGFLWYGIEQPILDRTFDTWNLKNEQYYWELSYALQKQDINLLEKVLEKYFVEFVVFDDNLVFLVEKEYAKISLKTKELLTQSERLQKVARFGQIDVYQFDTQTQPAFTSNKLVSSNSFSFSQKDQAFYQYGHYLVDEKRPDLFYPFAGLFTNRFQEEIDFEIKEKNDHWLISQKLPSFLNDNYQIKKNTTLAETTLPIEHNFDLIPTEKIEEINLLPKDFVNPHNCDPEKENASFKLKQEHEYFELTAKNAVVCVDWEKYGFLERYQKPIGVKIEFEYQSSSDEWPQYCLWDNQGKKCLNNKDFPSKGASLKWEKLSESILIDPKKNKVTNLTFILDNHQQKSEKQIKYRQIKLKIYHLAQLPPKEKEIVYQTEKETDEISVKIPKIDSPWYIENPIANNLFKLQPKNCNPSLSGQFDLKADEENGKKFIRFSSQSSDSCLSWYFPDLPLNQGWLLEIEYRHQKSYPLLVASFDGLNRYKFFYTKLTKNKDWQKTYFVIPPISETDKGIVLYFSNVSFSQFETVNDFTSVRIIPLPWQFLKSIRFVKETNPQKTAVIPLETRHNLWLYSLSLPKQNDQQTPTQNHLILPQSYDPGWVAINMNKNKPKMLKHVVINNWANGWLVEKETADQINIFFLPQILQFIGFLLLGIVFVSILLF